MSFRELIKSDFLAYNNSKSFLKEYFHTRGLRITFWLRLTQYARQKNKLLYYPVRFIYGRISRKYGVHIPIAVPVGKALKIFHGFGLVVNSLSIIGEHVILQHEVTLAGNGKGAPVIGDHVKLMPGCKIIGKVKIGNNVIVGANSVVTKDVPDNAVVAGIPSRILYFVDEQGNKLPTG